MFNRTLLIVDDEQEALNGYRDFLSPTKQTARKSSRDGGSVVSSPATKQEEYKLLLASTGERAIELVKAELAAGQRIAAGFFDVKLGAGIDGLTAIQKIRELDKDIHCVVVTAYHDRNVDDIAALFGDGFNDQWDYLNKPFSQGEVVQKARQMTSAWNRKRELELMNQQLIKSERMAAIGQVAGGVGHELGNILFRVMGKADLALMETDMQKVKDHLQVVIKATERAGVIIKNLSSISKGAKTGLQLSDKPLSQPVEEALSLVGHELVKASITVEREFTEVPLCHMDVGSLAQVFLNLLINAMHATPKGGTVKVFVGKAEGPDGKNGACVRVSDTGHGIPPEVLPRIFELAFSTKGERGSGLGLSISKQIVESHGGSITVKTEVGRGTEFGVWLPLPSE